MSNLRPRKWPVNYSDTKVVANELAAVKVVKVSDARPSIKAWNLKIEKSAEQIKSLQSELKLAKQESKRAGKDFQKELNKAKSEVASNTIICVYKYYNLSYRFVGRKRITYSRIGCTAKANLWQKTKQVMLLFNHICS